MCGIYCHVSKTQANRIAARDADILKRRGPDALRTHEFAHCARETPWYLTFKASVLSLRGSTVETQPQIDEDSGCVFCWNGEAWLFDGQEVSGNDTLLIASSLFDTVRQCDDPHNAILQHIGQITGPFAFVFWHASSATLYFGRDTLGRRSLLLRNAIECNGELTITSVATEARNIDATEVPTPYIHWINLNQASPVVETAPVDIHLRCINKLLPLDEWSIGNIPSYEAQNDLRKNLMESMRFRVQAIPTYTAFEGIAQPSKVAILFSGGLDCTLLARLAHEILPKGEPIDLINVAFENPRVVNARAQEKTRHASTGASDTYETCPDRVTGRSSFAELAVTCSSRVWRFIAVNVPYDEFMEHRSTIVELMYPHNTEMDLSITSALYFAARGQGVMNSQVGAISSPKYTSTARVLLSGLGADELFGGYARHAAAFARSGYDGLNDELELDFRRIGTRNLGRDDRIIAHWGRETRYPFLDEHFIQFALGLPAWQKCGFRSEKVIAKHFETTSVPQKMEDLHPEKMILRCVLWQLGMRSAAAEKKRAIQFGARTAKMHAGKTKGTDIVAVDSFSINGT